MMKWWWSDDELVMNRWWTADEQLMNSWWTDDELIWSAKDYHRLQQTATDWLVLLHWTLKPISGMYTYIHSTYIPDSTNYKSNASGANNANFLLLLNPKLVSPVIMSLSNSCMNPECHIQNQQFDLGLVSLCLTGCCCWAGPEKARCILHESATC